MTERNEQVIIIGAGIAGLTAAWHLKKCGIQALVLEADQQVGGRMKTIKIDDALSSAKILELGFKSLAFCLGFASFGI